jgi:hypothetical protein
VGEVWRNDNLHTNVIALGDRYHDSGAHILRQRGNFLSGARVLIIAISAATGTCFTVLAGLSIGAVAVPVRRFHVTSLLLAIVTVYLGFQAFRASMTGLTDAEADDRLVMLLSRGMMGAFLGLILIVALLLMFGTVGMSLLAHALGQRTSSFTPFRLLVAAVLLGFGTGFTLRVGGPWRLTRKGS